MSERKRDFNITFKGLAYVAATFLKLLYISRLLCLVILLISAYQLKYNLNILFPPSFIVAFAYCKASIAASTLPLMPSGLYAFAFPPD